MGKVKEAIETKRQWMNNQMQACNAAPLFNDPPIKVNQVFTTTKVCITWLSVSPIVHFMIF